MKQKLNCSIVLDLLPSYINKLTSEESNRQVKQHIADCEECSVIYNEMRREIDTGKFLKKIKFNYVWIGLLYGIMIMGILISFFIDNNINNKLTWSIIVAASITYFSFCVSILIWGNEKRFIKALGCGSILVIPLLFCIEFVLNKNYHVKFQYWALNPGMGITFIWLLVVWIPVILYQLKKCNLFSSFGILFLLMWLGKLVTTQVIQRTIKIDILTGREIINTIVFFTLSIISFIISIYYNRKRLNE